MMASGRAPRGARGLKFPGLLCAALPTCRAPRGARGLKLPVVVQLIQTIARRAPRGARGLKFHRGAGSRRNERVALLAERVD